MSWSSSGRSPSQKRRGNCSLSRRRGPAYGVDVQRLRNTIDELSRVTTAIDDALEDADDVARRLGDVWTGEAASAHRTAHETWSRDSRTMHEALSRMRRALETAEENYGGATNANLRSRSPSKQQASSSVSSRSALVKPPPRSVRQPRSRTSSSGWSTSSACSARPARWR